MVGGAAYHHGKSVQETRTREEEQEARIQELEATQSAQVTAPQPPAAAAPATGGMTDTIEMLTKLGQLHDSGVLTDDEFEQQKRRMLAS
jgi:hypothetical protein